MISPLPVILIALVSTSLARPSLQRRGLPGAFYVCTAPNFQEDCGWIDPTTAARCKETGIGANAPMSIGPDPDTTCTLYDTFDCTGQELRKLTFPGIANGVPSGLRAIRCAANPQARTATSGNVTNKALNPVADARLAGGVGSMEQLNHLEELRAMEKDGFREGLIGFKKGVYY